MQPGTKSNAGAVALLIGVAAALLFIALAGRNLEAQGIYQDEVLQASGSFAYVGGSPIGAMSVFGLPVLNNSYLGAIKTGLYGMYLRVFGRGFTVFSWRLFGILAVALGLVLFPLLCYRRLGPLPTIAALLLLCTDGTAIVMTRHDWGPTALALLIRLLIIALLVRDDREEGALRRNSFLLGVFVAVGIFEKLSSLALLAPVAIALAIQAHRRRPAALAALALGGVIGGLPLIGVNTISFIQSRTLISFADADAKLRPPLGEFVREFPDQFLSLGAGAYPRRMIFGDEDSAPESRREILLVSALLAAALAISAWKFREGAEFRTAAVFALSVFGVAAALYLLPRRTAIHHHIQAIPFAYMAGACALAGLMRLKIVRSAERAAAACLGVILALLLANHASAMTKIEADISAGRTATYWDKSFTSLGYFGASERDTAIFILTDWGVGTAIYCLAQGPPSLTHEVFWNYHGAQDLEHLAEAYRRPVVYVVSPTRTGINPEMSARINRDAGQLPNWKEVAAEPQAAALKPLIIVRKFEVALPAPVSGAQ
jgi:hypothetical protein